MTSSSTKTPAPACHLTLLASQPLEANRAVTLSTNMITRLSLWTPTHLVTSGTVASCRTRPLAPVALPARGTGAPASQVVAGGVVLTPAGLSTGVSVGARRTGCK